MTKLKNKIKLLEEQIEKQAEIIEFLCNHDRSEIILSTKDKYYYYQNIYSCSNVFSGPTLNYIFGGILHKVDIKDWVIGDIKVLENTETEAIIEASSMKGNILLILNKATEQLTQVSDTIFNVVKEKIKPIKIKSNDMGKECKYLVYDDEGPHCSINKGNGAGNHCRIFWGAKCDSCTPESIKGENKNA